MTRGDGWVQCCICGGFHTEPYASLAIDLNGDRWDVCSGQCAEDAGIEERPPDWWYGQHLGYGLHEAPEPSETGDGEPPAEETRIAG